LNELLDGYAAFLLYNQRHARLQHAHAKVDAAVAVAYDIPAALAPDAVIAHLHRFNRGQPWSGARTRSRLEPPGRRPCRTR
jgi:hypothetical protein